MTVGSVYEIWELYDTPLEGNRWGSKAYQKLSLEMIPNDLKTYLVWKEGLDK